MALIAMPSRSFHDVQWFVGARVQQLPPHHDFKELTDNVERLADYLMDRSLGSFVSEGY